MLGFTDSTTFSNFFVFIRGKQELALGMIEWANRRNVHDWRRIFAFLSLVLGVSGATVAWMRSRELGSSWGVSMVASALLVGAAGGHALAVAAMEDGLLPIGIFALGFHDRLSYHKFEGGSGKHNLSERERLAESLGRTNQAMIMRNHGLLTVGASVAEAFVWMFRLNRACEVQTLSHGASGRYARPSPQAAENTALATRDFVSAYGSATPGQAEFDAFLRVIDRQDPSYQE